MNIPENLKYTKEHEWLLLEGDTATIGITEFAQQELGDVVYVEVGSVGKAVGAGEVFGSVDSVKTVSDLFLPVSGTILEFNAALESNPAAVNTDPFGAGWIVKIKPDNLADVDNLLDSAAYQALIS